MDKIKIIINGIEKDVDKNSTVQDVLNNLEAKSKMFVVELNTEIIQKDQYESKILNDGDKLEIVTFFGGG